MSKLLIFMSLTMALLVLESNGAKFAPFGIALKRHQSQFQRHERRFDHPGMRLKSIRKLPTTTEDERELQKLSQQPQVILLISPEEALKMHEYMTLRKI